MVVTWQSWHKICFLLLCREMTASRDALELELKHNEKEFASLVTEELEQRFARFEDVTLAAVSKLSPTAASVGPPASAPYRTPTGGFLSSACQASCPTIGKLQISQSPVRASYY